MLAFNKRNPWFCCFQRIKRNVALYFFVTNQRDIHLFIFMPTGVAGLVFFSSSQRVKGRKFTWTDRQSNTGHKIILKIFNFCTIYNLLALCCTPLAHLIFPVSFVCCSPYTVCSCMCILHLKY